MGKRFFQKILVAMVMIFPLLSGNSCSKDKCGCSGDLQGTTTDLILKASDIRYYEKGVKANIYQDHYIYTFCNPNAMYPVYQDIVENDYPLLSISFDYYWNCQYAQTVSNNDYYRFYNVYVYYDINVTDLHPIVYGK